jgi:chromosome segregation ATPase
LAAAQAKHQRTLARFDRALATLERRGREKEETLRNSLRAAQEEWAKKQADRDSEITALQSNLLGKEAERQGELDRLAKQFAEERFQLEKTKEELEWKLKDRKEISERQLTARQKEIQAIENEIHRAKNQRDQEVAQKSAAFEAEKQKLQVALSSLHKQIEDTHQTQDAALAAKEQELQALLIRSKEHLRVLGDEFNQKVGSWRSTNESLRGQIEQLKGHVAQAQDNWEALRKEKGNEISALKLELAQWEARIKNDTEEFERSFSQERENLIGEVRQHEKELQETVADYERRLNGQDETMAKATEDIHDLEQNTEAQWHATLEQWQTDKQSLQQQTSHLEQELVNMQNRFQIELRQSDEAMAKLKMDIAFKETQAAGQKERLQSQMQRDLDPLRDRLARLISEEESQRNVWETNLRSKDDELKNLKARLTLREKRIHEETRRRAGELDKLRKQISDEVESARARYEAERSQLEKTLMERREDLARLQASQNEGRRSDVEDTSQIVQTMQKEREQLEESLRQILAQREQLRERYEALVNERDTEAHTMNRTLDAQEQELEILRENAKEQASVLRKQLEALRHAGRRQSVKKGGPSSAAVWNAFETGVNYYQSQQWAEAAHAFEECLVKDPRWGAAYQYLALTYHAQGLAAKAVEIAARAKELDPGNTQLATWADRLYTTIREQKAS